MNPPKYLRWTLRLAILVLFLVLAAGLALILSLRASLAQLDGRRRLAGLTGPITIERDAVGAPTIRAANREDAARALGFLHAQDRFFQMDLLRRSAAGELAGLFGAAAVDTDQAVRVHRFRSRMQARISTLPPEQRRVVAAYTAGVNAGLAALGARPPEYLLLRIQPMPWAPEDTLLVGCAMCLALHDSRGYEDAHQAHLRAALSPAAAAFFGPRPWPGDAALDGSTVTSPATPTPEEFPARAAPASVAPSGAGAGEGVPPGEARMPGRLSTDELVLGSNNWAVSGRLSGTGAAIVANDMHLQLSVPGTWYRARLVYRDAAVGEQDLVGVTLPGVPVMVVGSNRHLAWGFTAANVDVTDLVRLEFDPAHTNRYRSPSGWRDLEVHEEVILVRGSSNVVLRIEETLWGPVVPSLDLPGRFALAWTLHRPEAVNLNLLALEQCRDLDAALHLAPGIGTPVNNFVAGDRHGRIGYTLVGRVPERFGFDGTVPMSWADGTCGWKGLLPVERYPRWIDPPEGRLWTANNRTLDTAEYRSLNPAYQDPGARARQIRDDLRALDRADEAGLWGIYLDDRALFLAPWQELLLATLDRQAPSSPPVLALRERAVRWGARAAADSVGYGAVRAFRRQVMDRLFAPAQSRVQSQARWMWVGNEDAAWTLIRQRPRHLLDPRFADYDALLTEAAIQTALEAVPGDPGSGDVTWGQANVLRMQHPISRAVPRLGRWLDMPGVPMSGDSHMPRVHDGDAGVSERLVVSPGREEQGLFNLPGGQSGHFFSPFYRAGHDAWVKVVPQPLLPGPAHHTLHLEPAS